MWIFNVNDHLTNIIGISHKFSFYSSSPNLFSKAQEVWCDMISISKTDLTHVNLQTESIGHPHEKNRPWNTFSIWIPNEFAFMSNQSINDTRSIVVRNLSQMLQLNL